MRRKSALFEYNATLRGGDGEAAVRLEAFLTTEHGKRLAEFPLLCLKKKKNKKWGELFVTRTTGCCHVTRHRQGGVACDAKCGGSDETDAQHAVMKKKQKNNVIYLFIYF